MKTDRKELIRQALNVVYADFELYVKHQAMEHTIANLGQSLNDYHGSRPEHVIPGAFMNLRENFAAEADEDEYDGDPIEDEYKDWLKEARKNCAAVRAAGLPMTIENSRHAFMKTGPFAKEKKA